MSEPWFNPNLYAWIPGTLLGVLGGLWGTMVGTLAPQGRGKRLIFGMLWLVLACCAALLVLGVVALATGQPYGIWFGLGLPGLMGLVILGSLAPVTTMAYRNAEQRRMEARDLGA